MSDLKITSLYKRFGTVEVLKDVNLEIKSGEFVVFVGPSGCGKSTLLRCISGLETISSGDLEIDGQVVNDVAPSKRGIAMVFQSYALYPHMNVFDNMAYSLKLQHASKEEIRAKVGAAAEKLQLTPYLDRLPKQLSGGQRQRVAIGRAIVRNPEVFLFDEPLSNLDAELRVQMRVEISRLHKELGTTMIYVTHDQTEAMTLADKIVVLREGNVEQIGRPLDLYDDPANRFVAGFVGSPKMNFMAGRVLAAAGGNATIELVNQGKVAVTLPLTGQLPQLGESVTVGVRPEHFAQAGQGLGDLALTIDVAEHLGSTSYIYANTGGGEQVIVERDDVRDAAARKTITVAVPKDHTLLFDADGHRLR